MPQVSTHRSQHVEKPSHGVTAAPTTLSNDCSLHVVTVQCRQRWWLISLKVSSYLPQPCNLLQPSKFSLNCVLNNTVFIFRNKIVVYWTVQFCRWRCPQSNDLLQLFLVAYNHHSFEFTGILGEQWAPVRVSCIVVSNNQLKIETFDFERVMDLSRKVNVNHNMV